MLFCEQCRLKNKWPTSLGFPFMGISYGRCEVCHKHRECHDVPSSKLPKENKTTEEKIVDKVMEQSYNQKADELVITYVSGPNAGRVDHKRTEELRQIFIKVNGEVDWHATYHLRLKAQELHRKIEEVKRDQI